MRARLPPWYHTYIYGLKWEPQWTPALLPPPLLEEQRWIFYFSLCMCDSPWHLDTKQPTSPLILRAGDSLLVEQQPGRGRGGGGGGEGRSHCGSEGLKSIMDMNNEGLHTWLGIWLEFISCRIISQHIAFIWELASDRKAENLEETHPFSLQLIISIAQRVRVKYSGKNTGFPKQYCQGGQEAKCLLNV